MHSKGISLNSVEKILSHSADKIPRRTFCLSNEFCYQKFSSKGGGELHCFVENFFFSQDRKVSPGNHSVFHKVLRAKKFLGMGGGSYHDFPSKSFCLTVPKNFVGEQSCVSKNFLYRTFSCKRAGGGASRFCRIFLSHRIETKSFVKEPFCFPEKFW